jgi:hypothetical protein
MARFIGWMTVAVTLAALAGGASATHSGGEGPKHDFAAGTLQTDTGNDVVNRAHVNAKSGPSGEDAQGQIFFSSRSPLVSSDIRADVTCLRVIGNVAIAGGPIRRAEGLPPNFQTMFVIVQDFGEPGNDPATPDRWSVAVSTGPAPAICPLLEIPPLAPATEGNVVVHDATP